MKYVCLLSTLLLVVWTNGAKAVSCKAPRVECIRTDTSVIARQEVVPFDFPEMDGQIETLRRKHNLPGITVAVVRKDRLVYVNAYGVADEANQTAVKNSHLFRIASISKPVTVVALLQLMQQGKLTMDSKVFGEEGILNGDFGPASEGSNWEKITIRHLIEHKSGIHNIPNDPMFDYAGLSNREVIARIIAERSLASEPGAQYYYSNVGYNILGRVIEKITGQGYEDCVKSNLLAPCGITRMRIGRNTLEESFPDEVIYSQPDEPGWTYGMDVARMDSHGGWVASATDLARFIACIDRIAFVPDVVDSTWLSQTYMKNEHWNHTGSLPGTATMLCRMNNEFSFVVLINRRSPIDGFWSDISTALRTAIEARNVWPDIDLFKKINW